MDNVSSSQGLRLTSSACKPRSQALLRNGQGFLTCQTKPLPDHLIPKSRPLAFSRVLSLRIGLLCYCLLVLILGYFGGGLSRTPETIPADRPGKKISGQRREVPAGVVPGKIVHVPAFVNRMSSPWYLPARVRHRSLAESRTRILYSALRERAGDGIGHAFGTMNAEVGAALRLGLTYTHRVATYGSLTKGREDVIERLFGWGNDEIPREFIRESFCVSKYDGRPITCQVCDALKVNMSVPEIRLERIVEIPDNLTYTRGSCGLPGGARCLDRLGEFVLRNNKPRTLFQMPLARCDMSPVDAYIDPLSKSFFFHKYWDLHGSLHGRMHKSGEGRRRVLSKHRRGTGVPRLTTLPTRRVSSFRENQLIVSMHARRGDFFQVKRDMISIQTFGRVLRQIMRVVHKTGGTFAQLPVLVNIYSEGKPKKGVKSMGHDVSLMTKEFVDSDGAVRDAMWIKKEFLEGSDDEEVAAGVSQTAELFPNGLKVQLRIATDTIQALHEMISSDVFIGSHSALGKHIVSSLSRAGVHLMPYRLVSYESECCHAAYDGMSGVVEDVGRVEGFWRAFVQANQRSASRAVYLGNVAKLVGLGAGESDEGRFA